MAQTVRKVVLAYSGGLDTSVILRWLKETYRCEVVAFCADIGRSTSTRPLQVPRFPPKSVCGISPAFAGLSPTPGHVPMHYSPVRRSPPGCPALPLDLHV